MKRKEGRKETGPERAGEKERLTGFKGTNQIKEQLDFMSA